MLPSTRSAEHLTQGQDALRRGDWEAARASFETALFQEESPQALEGMGLASWWLDDAASTFGARERAYRLYRELGDAHGAARVATWLAWDYAAFRGDMAISDGWLQRAQHLLEGLEPSHEHGWLYFHQGAASLHGHNEPETARQLGATAGALGRSLNSVDLEMLGRALEGLALVSQGHVAEGMRCLDEATAAAAAGEIGDLNAVALSCCYLIDGCERVRDFDRAGQWCARLKEICERWRMRPLFAVCRTQYAAVLMWRGDWPAAETELDAATRELAETRPAQAVEGRVRLGELRRRQGRFDEASNLFAEAESHNIALLGLALLALDKHDPATAADRAERLMRHVPPENRTERAAGLEVLVRARLALGELQRAIESYGELEAIAEVVGTPPLHASACFARGLILSVRGEHDQARPCFEDALDLYERAGAPYESGLARIELARTLAALGRSTAARQEAARAAERLERIGALSAAETAMNLLDARPPTVAGLTMREAEVLRLVAEGLSNAEIARRLLISEHTVHRHVANVLGKLDLPSRAAAAAHAARVGLI
jgi:DNA-binding CsgD family transcriptional regulator